MSPTNTPYHFDKSSLFFLDERKGKAWFMTVNDVGAMLPSAADGGGCCVVMAAIISKIINQVESRRGQCCFDFGDEGRLASFNFFY